MAYGDGSTWAWRKVRAHVLERDQHLCTIRDPGCLGRATEVDHITPRARGGSDAELNLRAVCSPCHQRKSRAEAAAGRRRRWTRPAEKHPGLR